MWCRGHPGCEIVVDADGLHGPRAVRRLEVLARGRMSTPKVGRMAKELRRIQFAVLGAVTTRRD